MSDLRELGAMFSVLPPEVIARVYATNGNSLTRTIEALLELSEQIAEPVRKPPEVPPAYQPSWHAASPPLTSHGGHFQPRQSPAFTPQQPPAAFPPPHRQSPAFAPSPQPGFAYPASTAVLPPPSSQAAWPTATAAPPSSFAPQPVPMGLPFTPQATAFTSARPAVFAPPHSSVSSASSSASSAAAPVMATPLPPVDPRPPRDNAGELRDPQLAAIVKESQLMHQELQRAETMAAIKLHEDIQAALKESVKTAKTDKKRQAETEKKEQKSFLEMKKQQEKRDRQADVALVTPEHLINQVLRRYQWDLLKEPLLDAIYHT